MMGWNPVGNPIVEVLRRSTGGVYASSKQAAEASKSIACRSACAKRVPPRVRRLIKSRQVAFIETHPALRAGAQALGSTATSDRLAAPDAHPLLYRRTRRRCEHARRCWEPDGVLATSDCRACGLA